MFFYGERRNDENPRDFNRDGSDHPELAQGQGTGPWRLVNTLLDPNRTEWLPIFCYVIEHPEGLIVIDTGIQASVNAPVFFPPWMRLVQRAARFRISPDEEIGPQFFVGYCPKQGNDLRSRI